MQLRLSPVANTQQLIDWPYFLLKKANVRALLGNLRLRTLLMCWNIRNLRLFKVSLQGSWLLSDSNWAKLCAGCPETLPFPSALFLVWVPYSLPSHSLVWATFLAGPQNQLSFWDRVSDTLCSGASLADAYHALVPRPWPDAGPECPWELPPCYLQGERSECHPLKGNIYQLLLL